MDVRAVARAGLIGLALCSAPACTTIREWFTGPEVRGTSREVEFETIPAQGNVYVFTAEQWVQLGGDSVRTNLASAGSKFY